MSESVSSSQVVDRPILWLVIAAATVALMAGVKWFELHRPPHSTWVVLETRWAAPDGRLLGLSLTAVYRSRSTCRARRPLTGTLELRHHPVTERYQCVLVGGSVPWR